MVDMYQSINNNAMFNMFNFFLFYIEVFKYE